MAGTALSEAEEWNTVASRCGLDVAYFNKAHMFKFCL